MILTTKNIIKPIILLILACNNRGTHIKLATEKNIPLFKLYIKRTTNPLSEKKLSDLKKQVNNPKTYKIRSTVNYSIAQQINVIKSNIYKKNFKKLFQLNKANIQNIYNEDPKEAIEIVAKIIHLSIIYKDYDLALTFIKIAQSIGQNNKTKLDFDDAVKLLNIKLEDDNKGYNIEERLIKELEIIYPYSISGNNKVATKKSYNNKKLFKILISDWNNTTGTVNVINPSKYQKEFILNELKSNLKNLIKKIKNSENTENLKQYIIKLNKLEDLYKNLIEDIEKNQDPQLIKEIDKIKNETIEKIASKKIEEIKQKNGSLKYLLTQSLNNFKQESKTIFDNNENLENKFTKLQILDLVSQKIKEIYEEKEYKDISPQIIIFLNKVMDNYFMEIINGWSKKNEQEKEDIKKSPSTIIKISIKPQLFKENNLEYYINFGRKLQDFANELTKNSQLSKEMKHLTVGNSIILALAISELIYCNNLSKGFSSANMCKNIEIIENKPEPKFNAWKKIDGKWVHKKNL
ncbi:MAG: hypothetical protein GY830_00025 [Bacteroidetes bacterium]|nr:hypothetical protein [Bacteroidota bacterium]